VRWVWRTRISRWSGRRRFPPRDPVREAGAWTGVPTRVRGPGRAVRRGRSGVERWRVARFAKLELERITRSPQRRAHRHLCRDAARVCGAFADERRLVAGGRVAGVPPRVRHSVRFAVLDHGSVVPIGQS
jgi:hypothetical protein